MSNIDITDGAKIVLLAEALIRLHDAISEIVEGGELTVGDGEGAISSDDYHELTEALAQSIAVLDKAGVQ